MKTDPYKARFSLLDSTLEVRSHIGPIEELLARTELKLLSDNEYDVKQPAEAVIHIDWADSKNCGAEPNKWYTLLDGKLGYSDKCIVIDLYDSRFFIHAIGNDITIAIPSNRIGIKLPAIIFETAWMTFFRDKGFHPLHASGGILNANILFPGKTKSGKSTLALRLHESGGRVLSDDRVYLLQHGETLYARSFSRKILLRSPGRYDNFGKTTIDPAEWGNGGDFDLMMPQVLVFPVLKPVKEPQLSPISAANSAMRLISLSLPPSEKKHLKIFFKLSRQCESYELLLPAAQEIPDIVRKLLSSIKTNN